MRPNRTLSSLIAGSLLAACTANARFDVSGNQGPAAHQSPPKPQLDPLPPAATAPTDGSENVPPIAPRPHRETLGWSAEREPTDNLSPSQVHVVRHGDTLHAIAQRHGVTVPMLYTANGLLNDRLTPGQHIVIPSPR